LETTKPGEEGGGRPLSRTSLAATDGWNPLDDDQGYPLPSNNFLGYSARLDEKNGAQWVGNPCNLEDKAARERKVLQPERKGSVWDVCCLLPTFCCCNLLQRSQLVSLVSRKGSLGEEEKNETKSDKS